MIVVGARLQGLTRAREVRLALDTGAAMTLILPEVLDDLGYSARDGLRITSIRTANEVSEQGYTLRVRYFLALGFGFRDFQIHVHELPDYGVDGLLGMDFLKEFNFEVRMSERKILLDRAQARRTAWLRRSCAIGLAAG
jgi:predicted aspartyl protease